jgi:hypothetical protein
VEKITRGGALLGVSPPSPPSSPTLGPQPWAPKKKRENQRTVGGRAPAVNAKQTTGRTSGQTAKGAD